MDASKSIRYIDSDTQKRLALASDGSFDDQWHPLAMALSCFLGAVFAVSWLFQPGRGYWDRLDLCVFRVLNGTLEWGPAWRSVWAVANWRPFDAVVGCLLLAVLVATARWRFAGRPRHAFASLLIVLVAILATKQLVSELVIDKMLVYHRGSPTHVLEGTYRLNALVEWIECKDTSRWSFPGDHGFVLLMCAFYGTYLGRGRTAAMAWCVAILAVLPRLIAGAHWPTDIIVGSGTMALVTSAFLLATPLHNFLLSFVPSGRNTAPSSQATDAPVQVASVPPAAVVARRAA